jgi:hypothetical protein
LSFQIKTLLIVSISVVCLFLSGCSGIGWTKEGVTKSQFYSDRNDCERQAAQTYPVVMTKSPYEPISDGSTKTTCRETLSNQIDCTTNQNQSYFPKVDANEDRRNNYFKSCLKGKGYSWSWGK